MDVKPLRFEDLPDNLTINELKDYLRVGINKAYEIAEQIPYYRSGNRRIFPKEKVRAWALRQVEGKGMKRLRAIK